MSCGGCEAERWEAERLQAGERRARFAMCATCLPARRKGVDPQGYPVLCVDGRPLLEKIPDPTTASVCPRDRWPRGCTGVGCGVVRWLGVRWIGVPALIRWWLQAGGDLSAEPPGCGCTVVGKRVWAIDAETWIRRAAAWVWGMVGVGKRM